MSDSFVKVNNKFNNNRFPELKQNGNLKKSADGIQKDFRFPR